MTKKQKILLSILIPLFLVLFIFVTILGQFEEEMPVEVSLPAGNLSDSLFVLQNNSYQGNDSLPLQVNMNYLPYSVDMAKVSHVSVGNGYVFNIASGYLSYVTSIPKNETCAVALKNEYAKAILIGNVPEMANCSLLYEETGYLNGFDLTYSIYELGITDNETVNYSYILGYLIDIPDWEYDIYMSVSTMTYDTGTLQNCKDVLDMLIYTVRYDTKRAQELKQVMTQAQQDNSSQPDVPTPTEIPESSENPDDDPLPEGADVNEHLIILKQDYVNLKLEINWTNAYSHVEMILYDPTKTFFYSPESCADGTAVFLLGQVPAGTYYLQISGADYGEVSMTLKDGE